MPKIADIAAKYTSDSQLNSYAANNGFSAHLADTMPYKGKQVGAAGTSITKGQSPTGYYTNTWLTRFATITGAVVTNLAISGSTMAVGSGYGWQPENDVNAFCNRVDLENFSFLHVLFLEFATNEHGFNIKIGTNGDYSKTTFKGAYNYTLDKLTTDYPNLKIVLLTPTYASISNIKNDRGHTLLEYSEAVKTIGNKWNILVIDLQKGMGINENNYTEKYWDLLHPNEPTQGEIGDFIALSTPGAEAVGEATIKANLPLLGGHNLVEYGVFPPMGASGKFSNAIREKGETFSILPNATKASNTFLKVIPSETLYLTFWVKSLSDNQYYEVDLFSGSKLVTSAQYAKTGEELIVTKFEIPSSANPATNYILRFTSDAANISALDFSSIMLTRGNVPMLWSPAPGRKIDTTWKAITLSAPTTMVGTAPTPAWCIDGGNFLRFTGRVLIGATTVIGTIPSDALHYYAGAPMTLLGIFNDGTVAYIIIDAAGNVSCGGVGGVGITGKTLDLSSITSYFVGVADVR